MLTSEDARKAIDSGCDAIVVFNHGGRQLDGVRCTVSSLACGGRNGSEKLFTILKNEMETSTTLMGLKDVNDIDMQCLDNPLRFAEKS
nr:alpha-hydroxy-acid oxidizing protein [Candidimonas sp. SYP-B2681]